MMIAFCNSFSDINMPKRIESEDELKKIIQDKNLLREWYDYREYIEKEISIDWHNENNIEYVE